MKYDLGIFFATNFWAQTLAVTVLGTSNSIELSPKISPIPNLLSFKPSFVSKLTYPSNIKYASFGKLPASYITSPGSHIADFPLSNI